MRELAEKLLQLLFGRIGREIAAKILLIVPVALAAVAALGGLGVSGRLVLEPGYRGEDVTPTPGAGRCC